MRFIMAIGSSLVTKRTEPGERKFLEAHIVSVIILTLLKVAVVASYALIVLIFRKAACHAVTLWMWHFFGSSSQRLIGF